MSSLNVSAKMRRWRARSWAHALILPPLIHLFAQPNDLSRIFMTRDQRVDVRTGPIDPRDIRAADARRLYRDKAGGVSDRAVL